MEEQHNEFYLEISVTSSNDGRVEHYKPFKDVDAVVGIIATLVDRIAQINRWRRWRAWDWFGASSYGKQGRSDCSPECLHVDDVLDASKRQRQDSASADPKSQEAVVGMRAGNMSRPGAVATRTNGADPV